MNIILHVVVVFLVVVLIIGLALSAFHSPIQDMTDREDLPDSDKKTNQTKKATSH